MRNAVPRILVCALGVMLVSCGGDDPLRGYEEPVGDPTGDWNLTFQTVLSTCGASGTIALEPQNVRITRSGDFVDWQVEGRACETVQVPFNEPVHGYVLTSTESSSRFLNGCTHQSLLTTHVVITANEITGTTILDMSGASSGYTSYYCGPPYRACRTTYSVTGRRCTDCYDDCSRL